MKTVHKLILPSLSILLFQLSAWSQEGRWKLNASYSVGIPVGNLKNLTNEASFRGWNATAMYGVTEQISVGLATGFQDFYQRYPRTILHDEGSDISAVITNSIQVTPIMLKATYHFSQDGRLQPFASLAAGGNFIQYQKYYGQFADSRSKFGFAAQPELGIHIPLSSKLRNIGLNIAAAYNFMPFKYNDADGLHHISAKAGVNIPIRR